MTLTLRVTRRSQILSDSVANNVEWDNAGLALITREYVNASTPVILNQIKLAGVRLGALLQAALDSHPASTVRAA